jgi:drug/metabolite transporter (DMT)-like permease
MTAAHVTLALVCVGVIAAGQLLFKRVGIEIERLGAGWFEPRVIALAAAAFALYAAATLLWIHLLRYVELSRAYPFMALSFVLVPLFSMLVFGERLGGAYLAGVALIVAGVAVIAYSS